ncbi:MAG: hypothetical protein R3F37_11055 [Candidatus Competibacteraceae bacterium]
MSLTLRIIPARNEKQDLPAVCRCPGPRLPDFHITLVNDRSTDETGRLPGKLQDETRLRVLDIETLPEGWNGKAHALWSAARTR